ncbi:carbohydrate ABC transporter permease [Streptacidiphilus carbonis]|uniref:carbohydrate ABC transporter permease n=1 Tax=Streptacidiphilus carbonis TaxID=105422 RepID=UPI0005A84CFC|nr:sugar ABC transporter permease [Streptacidiphilus carbonis]
MSATLTGTDAGSAPDPGSGADSAGRSRTSGRVRRGWTEHGLVFTAPFLLVYALFLVWPLLYGVRISFSDYNLAGINSKFIGLDNYTEAFKDPLVWQSLWHTVEFTLMSTPPLVVLGLAMALIAHQLRFVRWLWRLSYFAPFVLPSAVVAVIWTWIFEPGFGLIDGTFKSTIGWLTDSQYAMASVVLTTVWWTVGFNFLLYLAALQGIPAQLYEAAELDGAGPWKRLWKITIPMLKRTTGLVVVLQLIASLKIFDQIYMMTGGGPDNSTRPVLEYMYDVGFTGYRTGYASAVSYILFVLIVVVSLVQLRLGRNREEG